MPPRPDAGGSFNFPIDFNRHGKYPEGNGPTQKSLNMLFCDGHADAVSAREAHHAIRFTAGSAPQG
jgi:prepilin-type processing-associated H-X9-DG protein